jgi:hypothetical protein
MVLLGFGKEHPSHHQQQAAATIHWSATSHWLPFRLPLPSAIHGTLVHQSAVLIPMDLGPTVSTSAEA